ncbi:MAG: MerR family transcriptional regulator [Burkholderiaceae bacterium]
MDSLTPAPTKLLSIGAISRETGIHVSTIRMWEARYGALTPVRTEGGARRYSSTDLERLRLIKLLLDRGHKPSALASLSLDQLHAELLGPDKRGSAVPTARRIASMGSATWRSILFTDPAMKAWTPTAHFDELTDVEHRLESFDVGIVLTPALQMNLAKYLAAALSVYKTKTVIVIYEFSSSSVIRFLSALGIECIKYPAAPMDLARSLSAIVEARQADHQAPAQPRFGIEQLQTIAATDTNLLCECPKHLASLIISLHSFIQYSNQCVNDSPKDALIHEKLRDIAGLGIMQLESGLDLVLEADKINRQHAA